MPDMVNIYCAVIRSVVEYASPVFSNLPAILCCTLERIKAKACILNYFAWSIVPGSNVSVRPCAVGSS